MKRNIGSADKVIRILAAVIIAILYFAKQITGTAAIILLVVAGALIVTSFISFCPLYWSIGLSTKKE